LVLHENAARPAVILAGGIGITPFRSMVADATHRSLPHKIVLLFSNSKPRNAPFLDELQELASKNPNFTFVPTMDKLEGEAWAGEQGQITAELVKKHLPEGQPMFYLAGPAGMVKAMRTLLNGIGVSNDDVRTEEFTGY
jgi:ferredoxin-NADP reductase